MVRLDATAKRKVNPHRVTFSVSSCQLCFENRGTGVPPVRHERDARATSASSAHFHGLRAPLAERPPRKPR